MNKSFLKSTVSLLILFYYYFNVCSINYSNIKYGSVTKTVKLGLLI